MRQTPLLDGHLVPVAKTSILTVLKIHLFSFLSVWFVSIYSVWEDYIKPQKGCPVNEGVDVLS